MEWGVFNWNENALNYYKRRGAVDLTTTEEIHLFRINEEHMHAMIETWMINFIIYFYTLDNIQI